LRVVFDDRLRSLFDFGEQAIVSLAHMRTMHFQSALEILRAGEAHATPEQ